MDEALEIADYIIIMRDGQVEQMAEPKALIEHQVNDFVREFIGDGSDYAKKRFWYNTPLHTLLTFTTKHGMVKHITSKFLHRSKKQFNY